MELKKVPKSSKKFYCKKCDYSTSRESQYNRHIITRKHQMELNGIKKSSKYICEKCNKMYETQSGLWKHQSKCKKETLECMNKKELIDIVIENKELLKKTKKEMNNLSSKGTTINNTTINNTTINTNNYNINIFLNENCKDALNIMEFVNSLQLSLNNVNKIDYAKGLSHIFIEGLKNLDVNKRPLHCTDLQEETIYIKDNDVWELDDENNKIKSAIDKFNKETIKNIPIMLEEGELLDENSTIDVVKNIINSNENDIENTIKVIAKENVI